MKNVFIGRRRFIALALVVCTVSTWFVLLQRPLHQSAARVAGELTAAAGNLGAAQQQVAQYEDYRRQADATRRALGELKRMIPERESVPRLMITLEEMADQADVSLVGIRIVGSSQSGPVAEQRIELKMAGRYDDLRAMLARLEGLVAPAASGLRVRGRLLQVTALTLTADPAAESTPDTPLPLLATILLSAYTWKGEQPDAPAADSP